MQAVVNNSTEPVHVIVDYLPVVSLSPDAMFWLKCIAGLLFLLFAYYFVWKD